MKRRRFLFLIGATGGTLATAGLPFGFARMLAPPASAVELHRRLRPPGALKDDAAFVAACIDCGLCAEVCPPRCITFYKRDGGDLANTPYINPEDKACTLCMKCGIACPTDAIKEIPHAKSEILKQVDMGTAQIDRAACYPWINEGVCGACVSVCPLGATAIDNLDISPRPAVKKACVGCGLCVEACPHPSLPIRIVERSNGTIMQHVDRLQGA